jgi:hypothetical protein
MPGIVPPITPPEDSSSRARYQIDGAVSPRCGSLASSVAARRGALGHRRPGVRRPGQPGAGQGQKVGRWRRCGGAGQPARNPSARRDARARRIGQDVAQPLGRQRQRGARRGTSAVRCADRSSAISFVDGDRIGRLSRARFPGGTERIRARRGPARRVDLVEPGVEAGRIGVERGLRSRPDRPPIAGPAHKGRVGATAVDRQRRSPNSSDSRPWAVRRSIVICHSRSCAWAKPRPKNTSGSVAPKICGTLCVVAHDLDRGRQPRDPQCRIVIGQRARRDPIPRPPRQAQPAPAPPRSAATASGTGSACRLTGENAPRHIAGQRKPVGGRLARGRHGTGGISGTGRDGVSDGGASGPAGHDVTVYNRTGPRPRPGSPNMAAARRRRPPARPRAPRFVIACVGNDDDLRSVCEGVDGAFESGAGDGVRRSHHRVGRGDAASRGRCGGARRGLCRCARFGRAGRGRERAAVDHVRRRRPIMTRPSR